MTPLLEVKNLVTEFRSDIYNVKAVNDVSFTVHKGRTLGIVGESGSGKSVTSLSVMRLVPDPPGRITGGQVLFHEQHGVKDLLKIPEDEMRGYRGNRIAMIFQEPMTSLNPVFTCGDQIIEAIRLHQHVSKDEAAARTLQLLKEVQLPRPESMMKSYPHQLSGGQKQRVMIAMAMSCNPSLLIADEPTTALDVTVQATILDLMRDLQKRHDMSMMFITHDLGVIAEIADDVIVMYKGRIVETGSVQQIFEDPQHPYTKGLLACRPRLDKKLKILPTVRDFMDETADGIITERSHETVDARVHDLEFSRAEIDARNASLAATRPLLDVKNLEVHFPIKSGLFGKTTGYVKAVDGITFDVKPGETLGLVGESGCGKTTTGRAVLRLVEPTGGDVMFDGHNVRALSGSDLKTMRRDFQIIFQDPYSSLNPRLSVGSAIMEVLSVHGIGANDRERKEQVQYLLDKVNLLPRHFNNYPHEFSGGQRQRICIARALALKPKLLICDESVSALDVSVQAQVLNLLVQLRDEFKLTYIFISHDLSVVKFISDRIAVMNAGKIVETGTAQSIYAAPEQDYTRRLISAIPLGTVDVIKRRMADRSAA
ncbi:MAG: ABC transporter ATP-binding protein ['Candidatus Kapabacteria' thiocyanatum]|uniref:ABC transporter ATP-binding protein n=1 Tax=Candidatus Kapaibacterium thiocyanatum TaxID=1895771 RepID=A0A1M3L5P4_9BACT|nr:ABC transporter ATP-binding protein ['Candidatus Kapabacteria' thiocyanatum]OJX60882.1 MAG: ABC transporter ATP-binding protein ['Candidatus Kapabacteria' thiocyanatum]